MVKKRSPAYSRRKGHNAERAITKLFKDIGYEDAATSRYASRLLDDCKVDIANVPYNVQSKAVEANIDYIALIKEIKDNLSKKFKERLEYPTVVAHKRNRKTLYIMEEDDFFEMVRSIHDGEEIFQRYKELLLKSKR